MTSQNVFISFNFENAWIFNKIYHIYCNVSLKMLVVFVLTMFDLIGMIFYSSWTFFLSNLRFKLQEHGGLNLYNFYITLCIKQIDFILACVCTVIDHRRRHSVERIKSRIFCSFHAMTSSVIYYSTNAR